jgi:hypothetical protein
VAAAAARGVDAAGLATAANLGAGDFTVDLAVATARGWEAVLTGGQGRDLRALETTLPGVLAARGWAGVHHFDAAALLGGALPALVTRLCEREPGAAALA